MCVYFRYPTSESEAKEMTSSHSQPLSAPPCDSTLAHPESPEVIFELVFLHLGDSEELWAGVTGSSRVVKVPP